GAEAKEAVPALGQLLKKTDTRSRVGAAYALWKIDRQTKETLPVLIEALGDEAGADLTVGFRIKVAQALAEIGLKEKTAVVPALVEKLKGENRRVCLAVGEALKKVDPKAAAAAGVR